MSSCYLQVKMPYPYYPTHVPQNKLLRAVPSTTGYEINFEKGKNKNKENKTNTCAFFFFFNSSVLHWAPKTLTCIDQ